VSAQGPGGFATGSGVSVTPNSVSFIGEVFDDGQGTITKDFPLSESVIVDSFSGTISFFGMNGHCGGNDIATVGFLNNGSDALVIWDLQSHGEIPVNIPVSGSFPSGIPVSKLHFESFNDLCLPTNFRVALTFHRVNEHSKGE
jgi:hypothetical protein